MQSIKSQKDEIGALREAHQVEELLERLSKLPPVEIAELLWDMELPDLLEILAGLPSDLQGLTLSYFDIPMLHQIFDAMDRRTFARAFVAMDTDVRADLYQDLSKENQLQLLPFLDKKTREDVIHLSSYEPETAGGIMTTDFATVEMEMTVDEAIEKIRRDSPSRKMIYYIYAVNQEMKMEGFFTLKDLILARPSTRIKKIVRTEFVYADVNEDQESVARKIEKYDLVAIPVLNFLGQLVGIVNHDEAISVIRAEHTEDLEKFMGILPGEPELEYLDRPAWMHFKNRVVWLVSLAGVGIISGMIIHRFEDAISRLVVLALYMPMVADTGGNAGSQAATVVVRALALGQITLKEWALVLWKELKIAVMLCLVLGVLSFGKILFLSYETDIPAAYNLLSIASAISLALALQVVSATLIGAGLPLLVRQLGGDPAVAASPAITTIVDITGLLLYFGTAMLLLGIG